MYAITEQDNDDSQMSEGEQKKLYLKEAINESSSLGRLEEEAKSEDFKLTP